MPVNMSFTKNIIIIVLDIKFNGVYKIIPNLEFHNQVGLSSRIDLKKPLFNRQTYFWILFYIIYYFTISMSSLLEFNYLTQLPNFINLCYKYGLKVQLTMAFFSDFLLWESNSTWTQFKGTPPTLTALKYLLPFSVLCLQNQFIKVLPVEVYGHRSKGCSWFN